jgi:peroxiredoxin Q/BCP
MGKQTIQIGDKAPALNLPDETGRETGLDDLAGTWAVIYFYPKDDTPGCTTEACEFTESIDAFHDMDAEVIGVSPDPADSHREFIAKHKLGLHLLSDPEHEVMDSYGAWGMKERNGKQVEGVIRSTVIVDPDGRVAHHWPKVKAPGHAAEVREKLRELQSAGA